MWISRSTGLVLFAWIFLCFENAFGATVTAIAHPSITPLLSSLSLAYKVQNPDFLLSVSSGFSPIAKDSLFQGRADFSTTFYGLTELEQLTYTDVGVYPAFGLGVAACYKIPGLPTNAPNLILTLPILAAIFRGEIINWSDPRIVSLNPALALPNVNITLVVQQNIAGHGKVFFDTLSLIDPLFTSTVGSLGHGNLTLNPSRYHRLIKAGGIDGTAQYVSNTPYSLSYIIIGNGLDRGVRMASLVNSAGFVVSPSAESVSLAVVEKGTSGFVTYDDGNRHIDISMGKGVGSWPLSIFLYLILNKSQVFTNCKQKEETLDFWLWVLQSETSRRIQSDLGFAYLPDSTLSKIGLLTELDQIKCLDRLVSSSSTSQKNIRIDGISALKRLGELLLALRSSQDPDYDYIFYSGNAIVTTRKMLLGETDSSWNLPAVIGTNGPELTENGIHNLPFLLLPSAPIYRYPFDSGFDANDDGVDDLVATLPPMIGDLELLGAVFSGSIQYWNDSRILARNPWLGSYLATLSPSELIVRPVFCCTGAQLGLSFVFSTTAFFNAMGWTHSFGSKFKLPTPFDPTTITKPLSSWDASRFIICSTETEMLNVVSTTPGAIGYTVKTQAAVQVREMRMVPVSPAALIQAVSQSQSAVQQLLDERYNRLLATDPDFLKYPASVATQTRASLKDFAASPNIDYARFLGSELFNVGSCLFGTPLLDPTSSSLSPTLRASQDENCWPFTTFVAYTVSQTYSRTPVTNSLQDYGINGGCTRGNHTLSLLQWLSVEEVPMATLTQIGLLNLAFMPNSKQALNDIMVGFLGKDSTVRRKDFLARYVDNQESIYPIRQKTLKVLRGVTCEGETMLVITPVIWNFSVGGQSAVTAISALGLIACAFVAFMVVRYRNRAVFRSSSWPFLVYSLTGLFLLFLTPIWWAKPDLTDMDCSVVNWLANLGFTITFGPLFAKTWRIYMIFGGRTLKVMKISNTKLSLFVGLLLFIDLVLLGIWQAVSPLKAMTTLRLESKHDDRTYSYTQCGSETAGYDYVYAAVVIKGILLAFGAVMSFSTRRVRGAFNESVTIAWSIYSVIFSVVVFVPVLSFVDAYGDIWVVLTVFLLFWISITTLLLLFTPKLMALLKSDDLATISEFESMSMKESIQGFSFVSVSQLSADLLNRYIMALEKQLADAKRKQTFEKQQSLAGTSNGNPNNRESSNNNASKVNNSANKLVSSTLNDRRSTNTFVPEPNLKSVSSLSTKPVPVRPLVRHGTSQNATDNNAIHPVSSYNNFQKRRPSSSLDLSFALPQPPALTPSSASSAVPHPIPSPSDTSPPRGRSQQTELVNAAQDQTQSSPQIELQAVPTPLS